MEIKTNPMERVKMLPENFDGLVRFTNWSDEDFVAKYNSKEYMIPKNSTVVLSPLMPERSPLDLLNICKKLALDLATREWGKSDWYKKQLARERNPDGSPRAQWSFSGASTYSIDDPKFAELIEKGLWVYPTAKAKISEMARPKLEDKLTKNNKGMLNSKAIEEGAGLQETIDDFAKKA